MTLASTDTMHDNNNIDGDEKLANKVWNTFKLLISSAQAQERPMLPHSTTHRADRNIEQG
jgi:valyl-tRNA synthetase